MISALGVITYILIAILVIILVCYNLKIERF